MKLKIFDRFKVREVSEFSNFQLSLGYDSFGSTFSFSFFFDPDNPDHKELACVTHYHDCVVEHNGETLVTGFAINQNFFRSPSKKLATISGYSKPGLFEDCSIPPSLYPLQSNGLTLLQIARKLTAPWNQSTKYKIGITVDSLVESKMNKVLKTSTASESDTIAGYLTKLAQQENIIISHDELGNLLFTQAKTDLEPIINFNSDNVNGMIPGTNFDLNFDGQNVYSDITVMRQASMDGGNAGQFTIKNPYCPVFYRPKVVSQSSGDDITTEETAMRELAKELESLKLSIDLDRWIINEKIIKPNNVISIIDPELYIYTKSKFFIRSVDYTGDSMITSCKLNCILPEVVNGKYPVSIFQGINLHP